MGPRIRASVGTPVTLSVFVRDRGERDQYEVPSFFQVGTEWIMHQGPGMIDFENPIITGRQREEAAREGASGDWAEVTTQATFSEPGDYVIRLRVDNFAAPDTSFGNQCCWSNGYLPVTVRP